MATLGDDLAGLLLGGRYRITRLLGRGGMGAVFVAHDEKLGSDVAVKVVREALLDDHAALERFKREARLLPELVHEHIVRAYGAGDDNGLLWIAMELLEGTTLRTRIEERGRMPWREALPIVRQIAAALAAAHDKGVIHRDLKPDNVMFVGASSKSEAPPDIRLLDFGVAKGVIRDGSAASMTGTGMMIGTPGYIAPEVIVDGKSDDPRSDLYALGVLWFELVTGARPFTAKTPVALAMAHAHQPAPSASTLLPFHPLPAPIDRLILRLMAKSPDERPPTARDLIALLDRIEGEATLAEQEPAGAGFAHASFPTMTDVTATPKFTPGPMAAVNPTRQDAAARQATPATAAIAPTRLERFPADLPAAIANATPAPTSGVHVTPKMFAAGVAGAAVLAALLVGGILVVTNRDPPALPPPPPANVIEAQVQETVAPAPKAPVDVLVADGAATPGQHEDERQSAGESSAIAGLLGDAEKQSAERTTKSGGSSVPDAKGTAPTKPGVRPPANAAPAPVAQAAPAPAPTHGWLRVTFEPKGGAGPSTLKAVRADGVEQALTLPYPMQHFAPGTHRYEFTLGGKRVVGKFTVKSGAETALKIELATGVVTETLKAAQETGAP